MKSRRSRAVSERQSAAVRATAREVGLPQGPGRYNPTRPVRFKDRKKEQGRRAARGRTVSGT